MRGLQSGAIVSTLLLVVLLLAVVELHDTRRRLAALDTARSVGDDADASAAERSTAAAFRALSERAAPGGARERDACGQTLAAAAAELSLRCGAGPDEGGGTWEAHAAACLGAPADGKCSGACAAAAAPFAALRGVVAAAHDTPRGGGAGAPPPEFSQETASQRRRTQQVANTDAQCQTSLV